jgi:hypothetical protein
MVVDIDASAIIAAKGKSTRLNQKQSLYDDSTLT